MFSHQGVEVHWLGHAGFKIKTDQITLYIDPFQISNDLEKGDLLFISHSHFDHLEKSSIKKVVDKTASVFCSQDSVQKIEQIAPYKALTSLMPFQVISTHGFELTTTPAYNLDKPFHPKQKNWLGFVFEINGVRIYFAGDTDPLPELEDVRCDIALFPVSGIYVMDAKEAAKLANKIKPQVVSIPMHWGTLVDDQDRKVGTREDAEEFCQLCEGPSKILSPSSK